MRRQQLTFFGVLFDHLNSEESANRIMKLIQSYEKSPSSRYVCTVNLDYLAHIHTYNWNRVKNRELLNICRKSSLVTADGMPIVALSHLMGAPLDERVTGSDLLPLLFTKLSDEGRSVYFLGSDERVSKTAALLAEAVYPGLRVVGRSCPRIVLEGWDMETCDEKDTLLVEEINAKKPDLLLICLGCPKQDIWFHRVQKELKVPVSLGLGSGLDFFSGASKRAPLWMQRSGLEWLYRIAKEPRRLWKRYLVAGAKFITLAIPLIGFYHLNRLFFKWTPFKKRGEVAFFSPLLFLSKKQSLVLFPLPQIVDETFCEEAFGRTHAAFEPDIEVFDFSGVQQITPAGFSFFLHRWIAAKAKGKPIFALRLPNNIHWLFKLNRLIDLLEGSIVQKISLLLSSGFEKEAPPFFFECIQQSSTCVSIWFMGDLGEEQNMPTFLERLYPVLEGKDCQVVLSYCEAFDSFGASFLLKLKVFIESQNKKFSIISVEPCLLSYFFLYKIDHLLLD